MQEPPLSPPLPTFLQHSILSSINFHIIAHMNSFSLQLIAMFNFSFRLCIVLFSYFIFTLPVNCIHTVCFTSHFHLQNAFKVFFLLAFNAPISWQFVKGTTIKSIIEYMKNMREKGLVCISSLILIPCNFLKAQKTYINFIQSGNQHRRHSSPFK